MNKRQKKKKTKQDRIWLDALDILSEFFRVGPYTIKVTSKKIPRYLQKVKNR